MKTNNRCGSHAAGLSCSGLFYAGAMLLLATSAPAQNLFVSDSGGSTIYQYTPGGVESIFTTAVRFPEGLAFDSAGNLFVPSLTDGTISEFSPGGAPVPPVPFTSGLIAPYGVTFANSGALSGNLFVADAGQDRVFNYTPGGVQSTFISLAGSGYSPYGLTFSSAGNLFLVARNGVDGIVQEYTAAGGFITTFVTGLSSPYDLKFDSAGNLYVADNGSGQIYEYDSAGNLINTLTPGTGAWGLAFDSLGDLFASDADGAIYKYTAAQLLLPGGGIPGTFVAPGGDLGNGTYLAFPTATGVPEQTSTLTLFALGALAIFGSRRLIAKTRLS